MDDDSCEGSQNYLKALDSASIELDINPFTAFMAKRVRWSLEQHDLRFPEPRETYISTVMSSNSRVRTEKTGYGAHQRRSPGR